MQETIDTSAFLQYLQGLDFYDSQVVHIQYLPPRKARYGELNYPLPLPLHNQLDNAGYLPLYTHQASAVQTVRLGRHVMVVTPAASGKTMCYNLPVVEAMLNRKSCRALYLFPTKALAHDQLSSVRKLTAFTSAIKSAAFDGDTPHSERAWIRKNAHIIITNPDMLSLGILPNHTTWSKFFCNLKYIVVDEAHVYRGVFGSHVSNVLRRLRRICSYYNSWPQFICCSATIANPGEHIERLVGVPFDVIDKDGSHRAGKHFVFWNPPFIDESKTARRSANSESSFLFSELVRQDIRTIVFARTRRLTELICNYARDRLNATKAGKISPYRAGYLPEERREIERDLLEGNLIGVVATTALELGVDIGDLDATVLTGYPGSIASTWQQVGRSGRRGNHSTSFLIGLNNPLDQYFMRHPDSFFERGYENALTNPDNPHVLKPHVLCAAWELPISGSDVDFFGDNLHTVCRELEQEGFFKLRAERWYVAPSVSYPAEKVNIRSASSYQYSIFDVTNGYRLMETVDGNIAPSQIHPGAIYLHRGESFLITELDYITHRALAVSTKVPYYTQAREINDLRIIEVTHEKRLKSVGIYLGKVEVSSTVISYKKKLQFSEEVIGEDPLDMAPQSFETVAFWFDIPLVSTEELSRHQLDLAGGLHAAEHASIAMLPLFALCDRNDIGGVSTPYHPDTGMSQVFIYDAHPGGTGIAEKGFELIVDLLSVTLGAIEGCPCEAGCPSCIQSPKCGNNNDPLDKKAAQIILNQLLKECAE
ncbi:MAG: DEAD/DEAH box helicase [Chloroflexota bacterium]|nr:DEAD/DEAH box helicase [Chloroflexota bacterium]